MEPTNTWEHKNYSYKNSLFKSQALIFKNEPCGVFPKVAQMLKASVGGPASASSGSPEHIGPMLWRPLGCLVTT